MAPLETLLRELSSTDTCVHFQALQKRLGWKWRRIQDVMLALRRRGYAEALRPNCWRATSAGREAYAVMAARAAESASKKIKAAKPSNFSARLWSAMRKLRKFTPSDVFVLAAKDGDREQFAGWYIRRLARAGILRPITGTKKFLLLADRDTGPKAPANHLNRVTDRNTGEAFMLTGVRA